MSKYRILEEIESEKLVKIIEEARSVREVLIFLNINPKYEKCRKYLETFILKNNLIFKPQKNFIDKEIGILNFEKAIKDSICWMEIFRKFNIDFHGTKLKKLKNEAIRLNIDFSHFNKSQALSLYSKNSCSMNEIFSSNSKVSRITLKNKIINNNLIKYECRDCGNKGFHNEKKLVLQIEHINGKRADNRLINLCFLCPNCHSQTPTFTGRNNKII